MRTWWKWALGGVAVLVVLAVVVSFFLDEPLRRQIEGRMNARMKGYTAHIGKLDFHPVGFAIDFYDVVFMQDAAPDPPVMRLKRLKDQANLMNSFARGAPGKVRAQLLRSGRYCISRALRTYANGGTPGDQVLG